MRGYSQIRGTRRAGLFLLAAAAAAVLASCAPSDLLGILNGPKGAALSISPSTMSAPPLGTVTFSADGGVPPYTFSMVSGVGAFNTDTATYTAPYAVGTAVIRVTDRAGVTRDATVTVQPFAALSISPSNVTVSTQGTVTFSPVGGAPPYTFSIQTAGSAGVVTPSIGASTGVYLPGSNAGANDVVQVADSAGTVVTASVTVTALSVIDYSVSATTFPAAGKVSTAIPAGQSFTIHNGGTIAGSKPITWSVYLCQAPTLGAGDQLLASGTYTTPYLGVSQDSAPIALAGTFPAVPTGSYYIIAQISSSEDTSPVNNVSAPTAVTLSQRSIDYVVSSITVGAGPYVAAAAFPATTFVIKNNGVDSGAQNVSWTASLSTDAVFDVTDPVVATGSLVGGLSGTASSAPITVSGSWPTSTGTWYLVFKISAPDEISTGTGNDTAASGALTVVPSDTDYSVSFDSVPLGGAFGATQSVPLTITRTGAAGHANVNWAVYLSSDALLDGGDTLVASGFVPPGNLVVSGSWSWPTPPTGAGSYFLIASIQAADDINMANNTALLSHQVTLGDFYYLEPVAAVNDGSGPNPPLAQTSATGVTLPAGKSLVIEGTMDAAGGYDTYAFDSTATFLSIRAMWATNADDIDLWVWDQELTKNLSSQDSGANAEPFGSPLNTSFSTTTGFVSAQFKGSNAGAGYVIFVEGN